MNKEPVTYLKKDESTGLYYECDKEYGFAVYTHPVKQLSDEEKDNLWIELRKTLEGWLCTHWTDGAEKLPLVDLLSDQHQESIASGQAEIQGIADELMVVIERAIIKEITE